MQRYPVLEGEKRELRRMCRLQSFLWRTGRIHCFGDRRVLHTDATRRDGGPDTLMSAYLTLVKHGAEPNGPYIRLDLVHDLIGGQAELLFCSTQCLRQFLGFSC